MNRIHVFSGAALLLFCLTSCRRLAEEKSFDEDGGREWELLVVEQGAGLVSTIDLITGLKIDSVEVGYNPHEIALSADGRFAYISNFGIEDYDRTIGRPGTDISVIDLSPMAVVANYPTNRQADRSDNQAPHGIRLPPGRPDELFVNVEVGDSMLVYDLREGKIRRTFPLPVGAHNFIFSPDGDTIFLFAGENGVFSFDAESGARLAHFQTASPSRGITYTADGNYLLVSCGDEIYLLHPADLTVFRHFPDLGVKQIIYSSPTPDGKYILAPCPYDGLVLVIDSQSGRIDRRIETGRAPIYVKISPDQRQAVVANALDDHLSVLDMETFEMRAIRGLNRPNGIEFVKRQR